MTCIIYFDKINNSYLISNIEIERFPIVIPIEFFDKTEFWINDNFQENNSLKVILELNTKQFFDKDTRGFSFYLVVESIIVKNKSNVVLFNYLNRNDFKFKFLLQEVH